MKNDRVQLPSKELHRLNLSAEGKRGRQIYLLKLCEIKTVYRYTAI